MSVRLAEPSDLRALIWVLQHTSRQDASYNYRYPQRDQFPADFSEHCRERCQEYLQKNIVTVYETRVVTPDGRSQRQVVAFSIWERVRPTASQPHPPVAQARCAVGSPLRQKRYAVPTRCDAFKRQCARMKEATFDSRYPHGYLFLKILYCHPDHQNRGAGRTLTYWGIFIAQLERLPIALFASEAGRRLYQRLGFKVLDEFTVQATGDSARLDIPCLVLEPADLTRIRFRGDAEVSLWVATLKMWTRLRSRAMFSCEFEDLMGGKDARPGALRSRSWVK